LPLGFRSASSSPLPPPPLRARGALQKRAALRFSLVRHANRSLPTPRLARRANARSSTEFIAAPTRQCAAMNERRPVSRGTSFSPPLSPRGEPDAAWRVTTIPQRAPESSVAEKVSSAYVNQRLIARHPLLQGRRFPDDRDCRINPSAARLSGI